MMLETTVQIAALAGPTGRGTSHAEPVTRRAHVEESQRLVVDERTDSATRGQEIAASFLVITQLEDHVGPGSLITVRGKSRQVIRSARFDHRHAPEHAEHWTE